MSKATAFLLLVLVLIVGGAILLVVTLPWEPVSFQQTLAERVNLHGYDEDGFLIWSLEALEGKVENNAGTFSGVKAEFYNAGTKRLCATGDTLTFAGDDATLSGGVEILHDDYRLETETVTWHESEGALTAREVTIFFEAATVKAEAFQYELEREQGVLEGGITATLTQSRTLQVVGERAEQTREKLILTGGVLVEEADESYRCASLEYVHESEEVGLFGGVVGQFDSGTIRAESIRLTSGGMVASGGTTLLLDHPFFGKT